MLVGCLTNMASGSTPTVTDNFGTIYSYLDFTTDQTPIGVGAIHAQRMFYGVAVGTGLATLTFSLALPTGGDSGLTELTSGLVFDASATGTATTAANLTPTVTTTANNDIGVACFVNDYSKNGQPQIPAQLAIYNNIGGNQNYVMAFQNFGLAGSQTMTYKPMQSSFAGNFIGGAGLLAFKSSSLTVGTSLMPDADKVQAYAATLQASGGSGSYTWTVQAGSLPTGLALNASTGAVTGTVTGATGNYPITFRVTESGGGTHADSSGLSIKVGATFGSPAIVQSKFSTGTFNSLAFTSSVTSGNTLILLYLGEGRHGSEGFVMPVSGSGGALTDSLGTVFTRGSTIFPDATPPIVPYIGCATSSGADTVTQSDNQSQGSGIGMALLEMSNTQHVWDASVFNAFVGPASSPYTITTPTYTVPVSNMALFSSGSVNCQGCSPTTTPVVPFSFLGATSSGFGFFDLSTDFGVAAGTTTASGTYTGAGFPLDNFGAELLFGLRPAISGLVCGGTPASGATVIPHRVREY